MLENTPLDIWYKDMVASYNPTQNLWEIYPMGTKATVSNLLAVVHGKDRDAAKNKMQEIYAERFPGRKKV